MNKILISGTDGNLGGHLKKRYPNSICVTRKKPIDKKIFHDGVDTIIHCAFNTNLSKLNEFDDDCYKDNIDLTNTLTEIPHQRFIYISSVQIPPRFNTPYSIYKKISEQIVEHHSNNFLILRISSILPPSTKTNSILKMKNNMDITLTKDSVNDFIFLDDVYDVIQKDTSGIKYLKSRQNINLERCSEIIGNDIKFGNYHYDIGDETSDFDIGYTSEQNLKRFLKNDFRI